jgi:23S rRNA (uracil1939-C5)-methyltransferase
VATATANFSSERAVVDVVTIDHVGHRGDGVAEIDGQAVYVPYALPGERVEVENVARHPDRRHLVRVDVPSADRIEPICPHFGVCGGCAVQHWREDRYRTWKRGLVIEQLQLAKVDCDVAELVDAHGEGRRRVVLHARIGTHNIERVGFAAAASHEIVPVDHCPILAPALANVLKVAESIAEILRPTGKPLDIQLTATRNGLDVDVRGSGTLQPDTMRRLAGVAEQHRLARITRHGELIALRAQPTIMMGKAEVTLPPGGFLQATGAAEETIAACAAAACGKASTIADLFCGVGPFALRLAERARIRAYDSEAAAIAALDKVAASTKGLKPIAAETRDLFRRPLAPPELRDVDAVVFDPPRQGALAQAQQLAASAVPVVVAVSCNPATFARDAQVLIGGGYRIGTVEPIDQFRYSPHVELVARFAR